MFQNRRLQVLLQTAVLKTLTACKMFVISNKYLRSVEAINIDIKTIFLLEC